MYLSIYIYFQTANSHIYYGFITVYNKKDVQGWYVVSDSVLVVPRKQTPTSAQQQLGSDDNKLPPGGTQTQQSLQVDAGGVYKRLQESSSGSTTFLQYYYSYQNWLMA